MLQIRAKVVTVPGSTLPKCIHSKQLGNEQCCYPHLSVSGGDLTLPEQKALLASKTERLPYF